MAWVKGAIAATVIGGAIVSVVTLGKTPRSDSLIEQVLAEATHAVTFEPAPIEPDWIREGHPVARWHRLGESPDGLSITAVWDCTAGSFDWHFGGEETVVILDGSVDVTDRNGATRRLVKGDLARFPALSTYRWTVPDYVRKVAIVRKNVPAYLMVALDIHEKLNAFRHRVMGGG